MGVCGRALRERRSALLPAQPTPVHGAFWTILLLYRLPLCHCICLIGPASAFVLITDPRPFVSTPTLLCAVPRPRPTALPRGSRQRSGEMRIQAASAAARRACCCCIDLEREAQHVTTQTLRGAGRLLVAEIARRTGSGIGARPREMG